MAKQKKKKETAIAIKIDTLGELGFSSDVSILETAVEKLSVIDFSEVNEFDKENAVSIINDWENSVISTLSDKISNINNIASQLEKPWRTTSYSIPDKYFTTLLDKIDMKKERKEFEALKEDYKKYVDFEEPQLEDWSLLNQFEQIEAEDKHNSAMNKWRLMKKRKANLVENKRWELSKQLVLNKDIQEFRKALLEQNKGTKKVKKQAKEKSLLAKTNINIASTDLKDAIFDILSFK